MINGQAGGERGSAALLLLVVLGLLVPVLLTWSLVASDLSATRVLAVGTGALVMLVTVAAMVGRLLRWQDRNPSWVESETVRGLTELDRWRGP